MVTRVLREEKGASAVEFAIGAPFLLALIYGLAQLAVIFFAQAGLNHAVSEAARVASIYPRPSNAAITAAATDERFGLDATRLGNPVLAESTDSGVTYVTISLSYSADVNLLFFGTRTITMGESKKVAVHSS
jgi:Flp pilus assembly protein TadG